MKQSTCLLKGLAALVMALLALEGCAAINSPASISPIASPQARRLSPLATPHLDPARPISPVPSPSPAAVQPALRAAPDFSLSRENGQTVRLSEMRGRSNVVLVFYRGYQT